MSQFASRKKKIGTEDVFEDEQPGRKRNPSKKRKTPVTAYHLYVAHNRAQINAENPGLTFGELSKRVALGWKTLSDEEKQVCRHHKKKNSFVISRYFLKHQLVGKNEFITSH